VIIYALLALLLWPGDRDAHATFVAGRPLGRLPARLLWLTLWGSMAFLTLQTASMASPGQQASAFLALVFDLVAIGIFLPAPYARVAVIVAATAAAAIWAIGENFGALFTGSATDPNSGLLLVLVAVAYWPAHAASPQRQQERDRHAGAAYASGGADAAALCDLVSHSSSGTSSPTPKPATPSSAPTGTPARPTPTAGPAAS
jgi:hypothetical protein